MSSITPKPGMTVEISMQGIEKSRLDAIEAAESLRKANEAERADAEFMRKEGETGRITAEQERMMEEDARNLAESGRILAEESRVTAENLRSIGEQSRVESEELRENAEAARVTAETERANVEALRQQTFETNEANRQTAFESAESARESEWTEIKSDVESSVGSAVADAEDAAKNANSAAESANAASEKSVRYDEAQTLDDAQKAQARGNIDAADAESVDALKGDLDNALVKAFGTNKLDRNSSSIVNADKIRYCAYLKPNTTYTAFIYNSSGVSVGESGVYSDITDLNDRIICVLINWSTFSSTGVNFTTPSDIADGKYYFTLYRSKISQKIDAIYPAIFEGTYKYDELPEYENFQYKYYAKQAFNSIRASTSEFLNSWFCGKTICAFGDSVTEQAMWFTDLKEKLKLKTIINCGNSGKTMTQLPSSEYYGKISAVGDFDAILVMAGINDWVQSRSIGQKTDYNDTGIWQESFYGSVRSLMKKMSTDYQDKLVVFLTPPHCTMISDKGYWDESNHTWDSGENHKKNWAGYTLRDYCDIVVDCGKEFSIPVIDLNSLCGWNDYNYTQYLKNDGGSQFLHPNENGGIRMAEIISKKIVTIK